MEQDPVRERARRIEGPFGPGPVDREILRLLCLGFNDHEIGMRLHRSKHTIKHRIEALRLRIRVRTRLELVAWAGAYGFFVPPEERDGDDERARTIREPADLYVVPCGGASSPS